MHSYPHIKRNWAYSLDKTRLENGREFLGGGYIHNMISFSKYSLNGFSYHIR